MYVAGKAEMNAPDGDKVTSAVNTLKLLKAGGAIARLKPHKVWRDRAKPKPLLLKTIPESPLAKPVVETQPQEPQEPQEIKKEVEEKPSLEITVEEDAEEPEFEVVSPKRQRSELKHLSEEQDNEADSEVMAVLNDNLDEVPQETEEPEKDEKDDVVTDVAVVHEPPPLTAELLEKAQLEAEAEESLSEVGPMISHLISSGLAMTDTFGSGFDQSVTVMSAMSSCPTTPQVSNLFDLDAQLAQLTADYDREDLADASIKQLEAALAEEQLQEASIPNAEPDLEVAIDQNFDVDSSCRRWEVVLEKRQQGEAFGFSYTNGKATFGKARCRPWLEDDGPEVLLINKVAETGLLHAWNEANPDGKVGGRDRIEGVNGRQTVKDMQQQLQNNNFVRIRLVRYPEHFQVSLDAAASASLGVKCVEDGHLPELHIKEIARSNRLEEHNVRNIQLGSWHLVVMPGMRITSVNGTRGTCEQLLKAIAAAGAGPMELFISRAERFMGNMALLKMKTAAMQAFKTTGFIHQSGAKTPAAGSGRSAQTWAPSRSLSPVGAASLPSRSVPTSPGAPQDEEALFQAAAAEASAQAMEEATHAAQAAEGAMAAARVAAMASEAAAAEAAAADEALEACRGRTRCEEEAAVARTERDLASARAVKEAALAIQAAEDAAAAAHTAALAAAEAEAVRAEEEEAAAAAAAAPMESIFTQSASGFFSEVVETPPSTAREFGRPISPSTVVSSPPDTARLGAAAEAAEAANAARDAVFLFVDEEEKVYARAAQEHAAVRAAQEEAAAVPAAHMASAIAASETASQAADQAVAAAEAAEEEAAYARASEQDAASARAVEEADYAAQAAEEAMAAARAAEEAAAAARAAGERLAAATTDEEAAAAMAEMDLASARAVEQANLAIQAAEHAADAARSAGEAAAAVGDPSEVNYSPPETPTSVRGEASMYATFATAASMPPLRRASSISTVVSSPPGTGPPTARDDLIGYATASGSRWLPPRSSPTSTVVSSPPGTGPPTARDQAAGYPSAVVPRALPLQAGPTSTVVSTPPSTARWEGSPSGYPPPARTAPPSTAVSTPPRTPSSVKELLAGDGSQLREAAFSAGSSRSRAPPGSLESVNEASLFQASGGAAIRESGWSPAIRGQAPVSSMAATLRVFPSASPASSSSAAAARITMAQTHAGTSSANRGVSERDGCLVWEVTLEKMCAEDRFGFAHFDGHAEGLRARGLLASTSSSSSSSSSSTLVKNQAAEVLTIREIAASGLLAAWNQMHLGSEVRSNDRICEINGRSTVEQMQHELRTAMVCVTKVTRWPQLFALELRSATHPPTSQLGLRFERMPQDNELRITEVSPDGLLEAYNKAQAQVGRFHMVVTAGMCIRRANNANGDCGLLLTALGSSGRLVLVPWGPCSL
ncbi:unnamed protein product [Polarella glacialis]|uniref:PDZ domain-containing protein n=1 Tax=Polarella glacialis TaxID=89957 RepID=A0A813GJX6_POLGL|nr:unnamed protein product [Polarella glacialis]